MESRSRHPFDRKRMQRAAERCRRSEDRRAAFRDLAEIAYPKLHGFFARRLNSKEDAHDLTQEALVRIYGNMDAFRGDADFETWMFAIATNVLRQDARGRSALKRGAGQQPVALEETTEVEEPETDPLTRAIQNQDLERLRRAVETLPAKMRAILKLSIYQERSRNEIALMYGLSPETVKAQLYQARRRLAEILKAGPTNTENP